MPTCTRLIRTSIFSEATHAVDMRLPSENIPFCTTIPEWKLVLTGSIFHLYDCWINCTSQQKEFTFFLRLSLIGCPEQSIQSQLRSSKTSSREEFLCCSLKGVNNQDPPVEFRVSKPLKDSSHDLTMKDYSAYRQVRYSLNFETMRYLRLLKALIPDSTVVPGEPNSMSLETGNFRLLHGPPPPTKENNESLLSSFQEISNRTHWTDP